MHFLLGKEENKICGIVGVIAKSKVGLFKGQVDLFQQIFLVDQIRGMDGAGIITDADDGIHIIKVPYSAGAFMSQPHYKAAMELAVKEGHFLIGHNRAATKGAHTWGNTHPFKEGPISLVHNGTLWDHKNLDKDVVVDSHAICIHMAKNGVEATLKEIDGAFALVWVNEDEQTINMARNKERPLHLIETQFCWIISSELGLGLWMAERHKLVVKDSFELKTETLYTFDIKNTEKFTTKEVEYHKWVTYSGKSCGVNYGSWPHQCDDGPSYDASEQNTPFETKRKQHLAKRKLAREEKNKAKNVIIFPSTVDKQPIPQVRAFGTRIQFRPDWLTGGNFNSAVIHDNDKGKNFLLGAVPLEANTEVRYYGKYADLYEYASCNSLEGTISQTKLHGKKTTYIVENIKILQKRGIDVATEEGKKSFVTLQEAIDQRRESMQEAAIIKYCKSKGLSNEPNTEIKCDCCSTPVLLKEITMRAGKPLCDTCNTAFAGNIVLAKEMGYV